MSDREKAEKERTVGRRRERLVLSDSEPLLVVDFIQQSWLYCFKICRGDGREERNRKRSKHD